MKTKCVLTAPDKATLEEMINDFYYSVYWFINDDLKVQNEFTGKTLDGYIVKVTKAHWQFRKITEE